MRLGFLKRAIEVFSTYKQLYHIKRVGDNLFKITLDRDIYYFDMTRGSSMIFSAPDFLSLKEYNAPFDLALSKCCNRAFIQEVKGDGDNRILCFVLLQKQSYKMQEYHLQFEFTGRNTNVILLEKGKVLEALRHINLDRSFRIVRVGEVLERLPQPSFEISTKIDTLEDFYKTIEQNYQERLNQQLKHSRSTAISFIDKKIQKAQKLLDAIDDPKQTLEYASLLKDQAKLLLYSLYQLPEKKKGNKIVLKDAHGCEYCIILPDEASNYSQAAQIFFKQAKRMQQKGLNTHIQQEMLQEKIDFHLRQKEIIIQSQSPEDIVIYAQKQPIKTKRKKKEDYESFFVEGVKISFGKNSHENNALLRDAKANDIWMHIRSIPSSHMILRSPSKKIPMTILKKAAEILVSFTKESGGNYEVDWTQRRFVKIIEGAHVNYSKYETITLKKEF